MGTKKAPSSSPSRRLSTRRRSTVSNDKKASIVEPTDDVPPPNGAAVDNETQATPAPPAEPTTTAPAEPAPAQPAASLTPVLAPVESSSNKTTTRACGDVKKWAPVEFGGPYGTSFIIVISHVLLYYVWWVVNLNGGELIRADGDWSTAFAEFVAATTPTTAAAQLYFCFLAVQFFFAFILPGIDIKGRADENGTVLTYRCNGLLSWWVSLALLTLITAAQLNEERHPSPGNATSWIKIFSLEQWAALSGPIMTVSIIWADALSLFLILNAYATNTTHRMSGNFVYDFFMGAVLHPRVGPFDLKLFAEIRISWFLLFINTASCAYTQWHDLNIESRFVPLSPLIPDVYVPNVPLPMLIMLIAHFLYANACAKGEHYVAPTWDIMYEKFGWMLCFWNFAGVPFLYFAQSAFIFKHSYGVKPFSLFGIEYKSVPPPDWLCIVLIIALLCTYYVWDTSQSQKNHFRLQFSGVKIERIGWLPWQILENPRYIATQRGTPLLIDGWWAYARKIHYTCDIIMGLIWGLSCGFGAAIPYLYVFFFTSMIVHRYFRDMSRCGFLYGADWDTYLKTVPYVFIPGII